ncbi:hypothetical protein HUO13_34880 [Saccharopolyspora erythraea]|uniref:hypothetical protein n=1 Tax=Saccharopolyspora erythraea TaxID=1836 RepID=UPI001BAAE25B|nr:hypothetical protein [Saccharopolyspora erythraea]QUH05273.1 hypothetical protein HUO13_34880 [Saccharopolyspora erythraea]
MIYVLAAIGFVTVAVLLWKAFGPDTTTRPTSGSRRVTTAPDDDPEFLRRLDEQQRKPRNPGEES